MAQSAPAPTVPEGIHNESNGPPELCGFTAPDLAALERKITQDPSFREENSTELYRVFNNTAIFVQFVFPRPGTLGFPMATCRKVTSQPDGTYISRNLLCGGSREECDKIFLEFQAIDERVKQELGG